MAEYTIYISTGSKLTKEEQIAELNNLKVKIILQDTQTIIVETTEEDAEKIRKLDWVEQVKPYQFVILAPAYNIMSRRGFF
jgi:hypothetical protein